MYHLNLSHMDFPGGAAAIHRSTTTLSNARNNPSPNELINPEISMKNHPKNIYIYTRLITANRPPSRASILLRKIDALWAQLYIQPIQAIQANQANSG